MLSASSNQSFHIFNALHLNIDTVSNWPQTGRTYHHKFGWVSTISSFKRDLLWIPHWYNYLFLKFLIHTMAIICLWTHALSTFNTKIRFPIEFAHNKFKIKQLKNKELDSPHWFHPSTVFSNTRCRGTGLASKPFSNATKPSTIQIHIFVHFNRIQSSS